MKKFVVVVAGGSGSRMKSAIPKQFMLLKGKPVLMHTLQAFFDYDANLSIILVLPPSQMDEWKILCSVHQVRLMHTLVPGGETRFHSVQHGLNTIKEEGLVAVHDGVRPLVSAETISTVFQVAFEKGNAVPCIALNDSLRKVDGEKNETVLRSDFRLIQTPQCFQISLIKKAFEQSYRDTFTDCASVIEANGGKINLVQGNVENIKITTQVDFLLAESLSK